MDREGTNGLTPRAITLGPNSGERSWDDETVLVVCHERKVGATGGSFVPPVSSESRVEKQRALASEDARQWHPKAALDTTRA